MNKLFLVGLVSLVVSGCSSLQPSHYTNYNTPYGNVVEASGRAANNAAWVNESFNSPSDAVSGGHGYGGSHGGSHPYDYTPERDFVGEVTERALDSFGRELGYSIDRSIRKAFR